LTVGLQTETVSQATPLATIADSESGE
jgi:hypothetical protein